MDETPFDISDREDEAFQRCDQQTAIGWKDELVVMEFLVTVRNGERGLIVMMLSVTVRSCTDG